MAKQEEKTPKEASAIFHNIIKASVVPIKEIKQPKKDKAKTDKKK